MNEGCRVFYLSKTTHSELILRMRRMFLSAFGREPSLDEARFLELSADCEPITKGETLSERSLGELRSTLAGTETDPPPLLLPPVRFME